MPGHGKSYPLPQNKHRGGGKKNKGPMGNKKKGY